MIDLYITKNIQYYCTYVQYISKIMEISARMNQLYVQTSE